MLSDICEELVIGSPERPLDPLYVQPASLEQATIRKKQGEELVSFWTLIGGTQKFEILI